MSMHNKKVILTLVETKMVEPACYSSFCLLSSQVGKIIGESNVFPVTL